MLEFDDIQYLVLTRVPAITGRYEFLSFRQPAQGRAWLAGSHRQSCLRARGQRRSDRESRWISVAFTWAGLRALGCRRGLARHLPRRISARHGRSLRKYSAIPARTILIIGLAGSKPRPACHCHLFARDPAERQRVTRRASGISCKHPGVEVLSTLDLAAIPPFDLRARAFRVSRQADRAAD